MNVPSDPVRPDYGGRCVAGIVPALLGHGSRDWLPAPARDARSVVLLVLDGLGWQAVERHATLLRVLGSFEGGAITTVAPSTTATALSSIATGRSAAVHGMVGFRMRVGVDVLDVLHWSVGTAESKHDPVALQPEAPFFGRNTPVVTRSHFDETGFTRAHLRGSRPFGWRTTSMLVEHCGRLARHGEPFVYAYYDGVDIVAHGQGLSDSYYAAELRFVDRLVDDLLNALPESATLLVTADHGQVELAAGSWIELGPVARWVEAQAGDARMRYLYARPGAAGALVDAANSRLGDFAWVFTRERLFEEGWLGPEPPSDAVAARVGDVALAAKQAFVFADPGYATERRLRSAHGSLTAAEMLVPLLAARGRASG